MSTYLDNVNVNFVVSTPVQRNGETTLVPLMTTYGPIAGCALVIQNGLNFAVDQGGRLYYYNAGAYRPNGEQLVEEATLHIFEASRMINKWKPAHTDGVMRYIKARCPHIETEPITTHLNVMNGLINLETGILEPHSPQYLSTIQLPITYDPAAECPAWFSFIRDVFPADSQMVAWELLASIVVPNREYQKAVFLTGEGSNGKSIYLNAIQRFIGPENYSSESLQSLAMDKFRVVRLLGKLANICGDLDPTKLESTGVFKLIADGSPIPMEYKFGQSFDARPFCRLVFSANTLPRSVDTTDAFYRRWVIIPFHQQFQDIPMVGKKLKADLTTDSELSGALNQVLKVLPRVIAHGMTVTASLSTALSDYRQATDPVEKILTRGCSVLPGAWVARDELLAELNVVLETEYHIRQGVTAHRLTKALKRLFPEITDSRQRDETGTLAYGYKNLTYHTLGVRTPRRYFHSTDPNNPTLVQ